MSENESQSAAERIRHASAAETPIIYRSEQILQGRREIFIEHAGKMYRLRLTGANKLYLTK